MHINSPVVLDFTHGTSSYTNAGYQFGNFVLTAAKPSLWNAIKHSFIQIEDGNFQARKSAKNVSLQLRCCRLEGSTIIYEETCRAICAITHEPINSQLATMSKYKLTPYSFDTENGTKNTENQLYFLLLQIGNDIDFSILRDKLVSFHKYASELNLYRGQDVYAVYAPFGAYEFMNSYAKACLSNLIGELYLIDGRLAPGCEGAPLYQQGTADYDLESPIGVVLFPIALGEDHSSYSLAAPMQLVSTIFLKHLFPKENITTFTPLMSLDSASSEYAVHNSVLIVTPRSWGSGVVVGRGLVLTNAHVIGHGEKGFTPIEIRWKDKKVNAQVVFNTPKSSSLDMAVLQYNKAFGPGGISFSNSKPHKGEPVVAIGYPLQMYTKPSLSKGIISSVWDKSLGFGTSCKINSGYSGGPIIRKDGSLLGIVIGIIRGSNCHYPEINVCMDVSIIKEPLNTYISTGDTACFKKFLPYNDSWLRAVFDLPKSKY